MSNAREMLARAVVQPNNNFAESAQALTAAFLAGRKTPQEIQIEAAKNALAQQHLINEQRTARIQMERDNAAKEVLGLYSPADTQGGAPQPTIEDMLASPEGLQILRRYAVASTQAGGKANEAGDLFALLASTGGARAATIQRMRGGQPLNVNSALTLEDRENVRAMNAQYAKSPKELLDEEYFNTMRQGGLVDPNLETAYRSAHPSTRVTAQPDGTITTEYGGAGGFVGGSPTKSTVNDLQAAQLASVKMSGALDEFSKDVNISNTGLAASITGSAPVGYLGQLSEATNIPFDESFGVGPAQQADVAKVRAKGSALVSDIMRVIGAPPFSDTEREVARITLGAIEKPDATVAQINGAIRGLQEALARGDAERQKLLQPNAPQQGVSASPTPAAPITRSKYGRLNLE